MVSFQTFLSLYRDGRNNWLYHHDHINMINMAQMEEGCLIMYAIFFFSTKL